MLLQCVAFACIAVSFRRLAYLVLPCMSVLAALVTSQVKLKPHEPALCCIAQFIPWHI